MISLYGIESYLSIHIGIGRFSVAQPDLGILEHGPRLFHATFPTFLQVFRSTFKSLWSYRDSWGANAGEPPEDAPWDSRLEDMPVNAIDLDQLSQHIQQGLRGSASHWLEFLGSDLAADMTTACTRVMEDQNYRFPPALWGDIVFQYLLRFPLCPPLSPQEDEFLVSLMAPFSAFYMSYARHVEPLTRAESELVVEKTVEAFSERTQYWVPKIEGRPRSGAGTYLYELG